MDPALEPFPLRDFAIAVFVGALVGFERERRPEAQREVGGVRTFTLFALIGALSAWMTRVLGTPWVFIAGVAAVAGAVLVGHAAHPVRAADAADAPASRGLTTEAAAIAVCLLGGTAMFGQPEVTVALGIAVSALLAFKDPIHGLVARIGRDDFFAALKLLVAAFVVLPLLPDRTVDPWDVLNPYAMGWLVVLVSALSFAGYVAVRLLGPARGLAVTGFFGGLVSSTAVTLGLSRRSREDPAPALQDALAAGVLTSWAVMAARVVVIVAFVHRPLVAELWVPMTAMGVAALGSAAFLVRRGRAAPAVGAEVALRNPFSLTEAGKFVLLFASVLLLVELARRYVPTEGVYVVAALAGTTDVDAISISMAKLAARGADPAATAAAAIVVASITNTLVKSGMACVLGTRAFRLRILAGALATIVLVVAAVLIA